MNVQSENKTSVILVDGTTNVFTNGPVYAEPPLGEDQDGVFFSEAKLVISGTNSNMIQAPGNTSAQYCLKVKSNQGFSSSTLFHIQDASANNILTFQPARTYYSIIFSSAALQSGLSCSIYTGGTSSGTNLDGLYSGGTYSGGTLRKTFTISSKITSVNF
jgi:hypothetical protein